MCIFGWRMILRIVSNMMNSNTVYAQLYKRPFKANTKLKLTLFTFLFQVLSLIVNYSKVHVILVKSKNFPFLLILFLQANG